MPGDGLSIEEAFRWQAAQCREFGAAFTGAVIDAAADAVAARGPLHDLMSGWTGDPLAAALPLRIAGAVQCAGRTAAGGPLADLYEATPDQADRRLLTLLIDQAVSENPALFREFLSKPVQTNEVNRTAALLGGFLEIAKAAALPLELFEIGSSGGLLLGWDKYRYDFGAFGWGSGALGIAAEWRGSAQAWPETVEVSGRQGCDINPIDFDDPEAVRRAACYIWPEQMGRRARFHAAIAATRGLGISIDRADAGEWLARILPLRREGAVAVVFHSVMLQYLTREARASVETAIAEAAREATAAQPFARLSFEPDPADLSRFAAELTLWPGGNTRRLAYAHPHAVWVRWL